MKITLSMIALAATSVMGFAHADTLQKVIESNKIVIGVRESGAPLSFTAGSGRFTGYHVEICEIIAAGLKRELKIPTLEVAYQPVTSANRILLVRNGTVDLECGTTTNNTARLKEVSFASTTFVTEVRMAVNIRSGITSLKQLEGKTVVVTTGSTAVKTVRTQSKTSGINFKEVFGKDTGDSFLLLESGRADAMVDDNNILAGNISMAKNPGDFRIVGETFSIEPIAIMLRKEDMKFKKAVDFQIEVLMRNGELDRLYKKWFMSPIPPKDIALNLPMSDALKKAIANPNDNPAESYQNK